MSKTFVEDRAIALKRLHEACIHDEVYADVSILIGVSPQRSCAVGERLPQTAHFESAEFIVRDTYICGNGKPLTKFPSHMQLPQISKPAIIDILVPVQGNGRRLEFLQIKECSALFVPDTLLPTEAWKDLGGAGKIVRALGCNNLTHAFAAHGVSLT